MVGRVGLLCICTIMLVVFVAGLIGLYWMWVVGGLVYSVKCWSDFVCVRLGSLVGCVGFVGIGLGSWYACWWVLD